MPKPNRAFHLDGRAIPLNPSYFLRAFATQKLFSILPDEPLLLQTEHLKKQMEPLLLQTEHLKKQMEYLKKQTEYLKKQMEHLKKQIEHSLPPIALILLIYPA